MESLSVPARRATADREPARALFTGLPAVQQQADNEVERRADVRQPAAFAFWIQPARRDPRFAAWMLNLSAGGAAFLTAADDAPALGERLELLEMATTDRVVRNDARELPRFARVLRHDDSEGVTRRVAVRFEADVDASLAAGEQRGMSAARSEPTSSSAPPPFRLTRPFPQEFESTRKLP
jgi:hypothetical protein